MTLYGYRLDALTTLGLRVHVFHGRSWLLGIVNYSVSLGMLEMLSIDTSFLAYWQLLIDRVAKHVIHEITEEHLLILLPLVVVCLLEPFPDILYSVISFVVSSH